jgi:hypothetical protein
MDDEDLEVVIALVTQRLTAVGAPSLADPTLYTRRDPETGEVEVLPPRQRLTAMLSAFERHLSVRDLSTYRIALKRINSHLAEGFVEGAVVVPTRGERAEGPARLASAPSLAEPRERLRALIAALHPPRRPDRERE